MVTAKFRDGATPYDDNREVKYPIEVLPLLVIDPDVVMVTNEAGEVLLSR